MSMFCGLDGVVFPLPLGSLVANADWFGDYKPNGLFLT